jgi:hypothetical protein
VRSVRLSCEGTGRYSKGDVHGRAAGSVHCHGSRFCSTPACPASGPPVTCRGWLACVPVRPGCVVPGCLGSQGGFGQAFRAVPSLGESYAGAFVCGFGNSPGPADGLYGAVRGIGHVGARARVHMMYSRVHMADGVTAGCRRFGTPLAVTHVGVPRAGRVRLWVHEKYICSARGSMPSR